MHMLHEIGPWFVAMLILIGCSAFFSASEAALFSLSRTNQRSLKTGGRLQQVAVALLSDPDRLLSAVLFWNLVVNTAYFAIASIVVRQLQDNPRVGETETLAFSLCALLAIILFSEMLPKSLAVNAATKLTAFVGLPLSLAVRILDPFMPLLQFVNLLSRRLIIPRFQVEPYLEVADLERAIQLSTTGAQLIDQEQIVLQNIVSLSEWRVDEVMRPRTQFLSFSPPVDIADLEGKMTPSGYLLITESVRDEVDAALHLSNLFDIPTGHLEHYAEPVIFVPWFTTVADLLQQLQERERQVAAVVNELGETIGIITFEDILDTIFTSTPDRTARLLNRKSIQQVGDGVWHVIGMTTIRRMGRFFGVNLPSSKSLTLAGVVQEMLQKIPEQGDQCHWGPFQMKVVDVPDRGQLTIELTRIELPTEP